MIIITALMAIVSTVTAFFVGAVWQMNRQEEKISARVIRPANINIEKKYHVTEYLVQEGALDIDFPETTGGAHGKA